MKSDDNAPVPKTKPSRVFTFGLSPKSKPIVRRVVRKSSTTSQAASQTAATHPIQSLVHVPTTPKREPPASPPAPTNSPEENADVPVEDKTLDDDGFAPSMPDLQALLACTQTGRKPPSPSPTAGKKRRPSPVPVPPAKRRRDAEARRRHHDFWAPDGSVVLQLENVMFRLHRSDLVRRSKYFADLLGGPPRIGEDGKEDAVDGCPVYHVPGKAKDFEHLWHAVDDAISYIHTPPPFPVLASILHAATTYDFPTFRTWAIKTFEDMWPRDLTYVTSTHRTHAAQSIILARACGVPTVLRHAFYELSRHPSFGLEDTEPSDNVDEENNEEDAALTRADLTRLIQLRPRLQSAFLAVVQMPPASCSKEGCTISPTWASTLVAGSVFEEGLLCDPLGALQQLGRAECAGLCTACATRARAGWARTREKIWEQKLDLWLGLA